MNSISPIIKIYLYFDELARNWPRWLKTVCKSFWLGILSSEELQAIDRIYYERAGEYTSEDYNESGFFNWERRAFLKYFQSCQRLLVAAIGGGREVLVLNRIGFETDGFECNRRLFEYAEELFREENIKGEFHLTPRDQVWYFGKIYDGAIIGWAAYMLIQKRERRIDFLKKMREQLSLGAPLLASFATRFEPDAYFGLTLKIGNTLRALLGREKLALGDDLSRSTFIHHFTEREIESEFAEAGFRLIFYSSEEYGHAVGIAV